jgi:hypothetical protein
MRCRVLLQGSSAARHHRAVHGGGTAKRLLAADRVARRRLRYHLDAHEGGAPRNRHSCKSAVLCRRLQCTLGTATVVARSHPLCTAVCTAISWYLRDAQAGGRAPERYIEVDFREVQNGVRLQLSSHL